MKIGILQTGHAPDNVRDSIGDYDAMFADLLKGRDFDFRTWNVVDGDFPSGPEEADGWLITGSRHGAYEDHAFIPPLEALIRAIRDAGRPLVGVCFGHQIIAQALGGKVVKYEGGFSVGHTTYAGPAGLPLTANAWHQDQVVDLPEGATVLAGSDFCRYAALSYGDRIYTTQYHPEFTGAVIEGLIASRGDKVPPALITQAAERIAMPTSSTEEAARFEAIFRGTFKAEAIR